MICRQRGQKHEITTKQSTAYLNAEDNTLHNRDPPPFMVSYAPSGDRVHWLHFANEIQKKKIHKHISTIKAKAKN
jgi:hypothetical protein